MAFSGQIGHDVTRDSRLVALGGMVGHTPLLAVHLKCRGERRTIFAKAEHYNLTGSIKDRMALNILRCGYQCGALKEGDLIIAVINEDSATSRSSSGDSGDETAEQLAD